MACQHACLPLLQISMTLADSVDIDSLLQTPSAAPLELVLKDLAHAYSVALPRPHLDQPETQKTLTLDHFITSIFPVRPP